jgi:lipid-binding SYLF domain-containing protein
MKLRVTALVAGVVSLAVSNTGAVERQAELMLTAAAALEHSLADVNAIPLAIMRQARAIAVFPANLTAQDVRDGDGVLTARDSSPGLWKLPVIVTATAKLHVPAGRTPGDIILVALSRRGFDYLANVGSLQPAGVVMSPGPVGRNSTINLKADIVGYARYRVAFAGIMVQQVVVEDVKNDPPMAIEWQRCMNSVRLRPEERKTEFPELRTATTTADLPASCFLHLR